LSAPHTPLYKNPNPDRRRPTPEQVFELRESDPGKEEMADGKKPRAEGEDNYAEPEDRLPDGFPIGRSPEQRGHAQNRPNLGRNEDRGEENEKNRPKYK
jgi:hypothetical protein